MANQPLSLCRVIRIEEGVFKDFIILNKHIVVKNRTEQESGVPSAPQEAG